MSTWFVRGRGTALGILVGALTVGSAAPHLVNGLGGLDWQAVVVVTSALTAAGGLLVLAGVREGPFPFPRAVFDPRQAGRAFRNRGVRLASLGYFGHMWELYAMWSWFLVFAGDELYADRTDAAFVTFAVIAAGGLGCVAGGIAGDRVGRPETTAACMAVSGLCALSIGFVPHGLALAIALVWGFTVVADSAQFSTLVTEHADQAYVGTALTLQLAVGFTLTVATIWLIPYLVDAAGWGWAFAFLAAGPALGVLAMLRLRSAASTVRRSPSSVDVGAERAQQPHGDGGAEVLLLLPEHDRGRRGDDRLDRDARPVDGRRDVDAAVARGRPGQRAQRRLRPRRDRRSRSRPCRTRPRAPARASPPRAGPGRSGRPRSAPRARRGRAARRARRRRRRSGRGSACVFSRVELLEPEQRLREARDGRERRAEVVAGERDQTGKVGGHGAASVTA